ncbi:hypothetical protein K458DRAFT_418742 [Lentithecium fluviatile CBS 122367]|uniref:Uncharacterized protein n=1 Tax=Lentithecium fluviatile CBS 122367 TaxID=1168545 RepID=A0A6G1IZS2_9PLEO|nr:hypothetical protein K458DRAFT_418742 [Lentithecium fluviatile CBS 122367]
MNVVFGKNEIVEALDRLWGVPRGAGTNPYGMRKTMELYDGQEQADLDHGYVGTGDALPNQAAEKAEHEALTRQERDIDAATAVGTSIQYTSETVDGAISDAAQVHVFTPGNLASFGYTPSYPYWLCQTPDQQMYDEEVYDEETYDGEAYDEEDYDEEDFDGEYYEYDNVMEE